MCFKLSNSEATSLVSSFPIVELFVQTVPALDWDGSIHTAFTVYSNAGGALRVSSGWTLKDALDFFARDYGLRRDSLRVKRPFKAQK